MNLLHVVDTLEPKKGGVSQAVNTLAAEITKSGINNEVLTFDSPENLTSSNSFTVHALGPSKGPWSYSNKLIPWLKNNLYRFDTVVIHGLWLYHGYGVTRALLKYKTSIRRFTSSDNIPKLFIMPHGMLDPYFQRSRERKLKAIRNWLYWKMVEGTIINNADGLLFTCVEESRLAGEPFKPYNPKKELVVGLGVNDPPKFIPSMQDAFKKCLEIKNRPYLLFLSRIDPKKGLVNLIRAYEIILNDSFVTNANEPPLLIIAGPGLETPYGKKIVSLVNRNPSLQQSVFFSGMLQGENKWGAFYNCDAFVLPSHQENFGIAVVEALACSKPVLISNRINISQEIKNAGAGFVEDDTVEGTVKMLRSWIQMAQKEKIKMGEHARKCYEIEFATDSATAKFLLAISDID